jgi:3-dehydroquinate synthase
MSESFSVRSRIREEYQVHFIEEIHEHLAAMARQENVIFVIDKKVGSLKKNEVQLSVEGSRYVMIEAAEAQKTIDYSQQVIRDLIKVGVRKNDCLVAVGGGITQDIVAFISSILFRGVEWKFFPTTLLAQCDSCIGSKSSINFDRFKNLLGTFNPPSEIFIYPGFLDTLSESEIRSGIGEMLHYFFIDGISLAEEVSGKFDTLLKDRSALTYFIANTLRIKKAVIEVDEFDTSVRHIFNYGHTFGHAIEAITNYAIPHGQAISIGMDLANYISLSRNLINKEQFDQMHGILQKNIPVFRFTEDNIDEYLQALSKDKKNKGNLLGCILTSGPGRMEKIFIDMDESLRTVILTYSNAYLN